jgi:hypothetical protein
MCKSRSQGTYKDRDSMIENGRQVLGSVRAIRAGTRTNGNRSQGVQRSRRVSRIERSSGLWKACALQGKQTEGDIQEMVGCPPWSDGMGVN